MLVRQDRWIAWLGGVQHGSGVVRVAGPRPSGVYGQIVWFGELERGRLTKWCLRESDSMGWPDPPLRRLPRRGSWSPPWLERVVFREHRRPDWSELVLIARTARRILQAEPVLDWLRETGAASVPCLGSVLGGPH